MVTMVTMVRPEPETITGPSLTPSHTRRGGPCPSPLYQTLIFHSSPQHQSTVMGYQISLVEQIETLTGYDTVL